MIWNRQLLVNVSDAEKGVDNCQLCCLECPKWMPERYLAQPSTTRISYSLLTPAVPTQMYLTTLICEAISGGRKTNGSNGFRTGEPSSSVVQFDRSMVGVLEEQILCHVFHCQVYLWEIGDKVPGVYCIVALTTHNSDNTLSWLGLDITINWNVAANSM